VKAEGPASEELNGARSRARLEGDELVLVEELAQEALTAPLV